jgi:hypothetical protein
VTKKSFITLTPEEVAGENKVPPRLKVERDNVVEMGTLQPKLLFGSPFPQAHLQKGASLVNLRLLGLRLTTLSIKGLFLTFGHYAKCRHADCLGAVKLFSEQLKKALHHQA